MNSVRCQHCARLLAARFDTDIITGRVTETVAFCGCAESRRLARICRMCDAPLASRRPVYCSRACTLEFQRRKRGFKTRRPRSINELRRLAGVCQDCDEPVHGKPKMALRCAAHRKAARDASRKKHLERVGGKHRKKFYYSHREELLEKMRVVNADPDVRAQKAEYKRQWRKKNRDKVRAQKRRHALRGKAAEAQRRRRERIKSGELKLRRKKPTRFNKDGERLCVAPRCRTVMTGRPKMCEKCKRIAAAGTLQQQAA